MITTRSRKRVHPRINVAALMTERIEQIATLEGEAAECGRELLEVIKGILDSLDKSVGGLQGQVLSLPALLSGGNA